MRVHKPADKKIKTSKRRTDDHKKGSKEREGKRVFIQDIGYIKRYGGHTGRQISEGESSQNTAKGLLQFLTFLLPLIHGKGVYFIPKRKE